MDFNKLPWYLDIMERSLTAEDVEQLRNIYAPRVVGVQPEDSRRGLCVMSDGELRHYGCADKTEIFGAGRPVYLSSRDCGLSWKLHYAAEGSMGAAMRDPRTGRYITVVSSSEGKQRGCWALLSDIGPGDTEPRRVKISDEECGDIFQPKALRQRERIIVTCHICSGDDYIPTVLITDDAGESWRLIKLKSTPRHEPVWPHLGVRWQNNGSEPVFCELSSGRLMLLARTSLDYLYVYYSDDAGEHWTDGEPSRFHCTLTTPYLLTLSDNRTLLFWNNTQPLAECNHKKQWPPVGQNAECGAGEDVFTNRDANHCAISDDGECWRGLRELYLNDIRGASDFRTHGGKLSSADKSVHQFQALELPFGKVLCAFGQHEASRRMVIFDVRWLYETSRDEDFQRGLENVSTHSYVKSISGCHLHTGFAGHCAWNRTDGPLLMPDPDGTYGEALMLCCTDDARLQSRIQGVTWNYPAAYRGKISMQLRIGGAGVRVTLCDRWFNPTDIYARELSPISFELTGDSVDAHVWQEITVNFDIEKHCAYVMCGENRLFGVNIAYTPPLGLSYLLVQSLTGAADFDGSYIRRLSMNAL